MYLQDNVGVTPKQPALQFAREFFIPAQEVKAQFRVSSQSLGLVFALNFLKLQLKPSIFIHI